MVPPERALMSSYPYRLFLCQHSFARNFRLEFWAGIANPQSWRKRGHRGSGMVPFESVGKFLYRPSIVTFPLSLRVSEILPACRFCSPACHFSRRPATPLFSLKFPYVPPGVGGSPYGYKERRCLANNNVRAISFQDFQPT